MTKPKKGITWREIAQQQNDPPRGRAKKSFLERAAEAEVWAEEMKGAPSGRPILRMGRPTKAEIKVETELVSFRTERQEKEALEALAQAQGRTLSELLRDATHDLVRAFKAGQKASRARS